MKQKYIFFIVYFLTSLSFVKAQQQFNYFDNEIDKIQKLQNEFDYDQAFSLGSSLLDKALKKGNKRSIANIFMLIGNSYELNGNRVKAINKYNEAFSYARVANAKDLCAELLNRIGEISLLRAGDPIGNAISKFKQSHKFAKEINDSVKIINPLLNLATAYIKDKKYAKAYNSLKSAGRYVNYQKMPVQKANLDIIYGNYYFQVKTYSRAIKHLNGAIKNLRNCIQIATSQSKLTRKITSLYLTLANAHEIKSQILYNQGKFKDAFDSFERYNFCLISSKNLSELMALQYATIKYEVEEYNKTLEKNRIQFEQQENDLVRWKITIILGSILTFLSLAFMWNAFNNSEHRKKLNSILVTKNSQLRVAKNQAEELSGLKSNFISTVSHELRTPLYGVIGLTNLLMENPTEEKRKSYLQSLKFSGDYLLALINDVLQLSKIETEEITLEKSSVNLHMMIEGITSSLTIKQKTNNNKIHVNIDSKINTCILCDPVRLSQILINLMGNALKFTKNGNVYISILDTSEKHTGINSNECMLRFSIKDDGIGIPKEKQNTIFESFTQVKNDHQEYQGSGLGLSIVDKLIQLHNSSIKLISEKGEGSEFFFEIKYEKDLSEKVESIIEDDANKVEDISDKIKLKVLIVDDNKINQIVTQNILKKKGYICQTGNNGLEAIDKVKEHPFDIILMDINMPEMDGLEATENIRKFNTEIPIIALTAVEEGEVRQEALKSGMNDLIVKPYDTQMFFNTLINNISKENLEQLFKEA